MKASGRITNLVLEKQEMCRILQEFGIAATATPFLICHIPIQGNGGVREFLRSLATASFRLSCESTHIVFHPMPRIIKPKVNQSMGNSNVKKYFSYWCGPSTSHWQMNRFKSTCFAKEKTQLKKRDLVPETHTGKKKWKLVSKRFYPMLLLMEEILHHLGWLKPYE